MKVYTMVKDNACVWNITQNTITALEGDSSWGNFLAIYPFSLEISLLYVKSI